MSSDLIVSVRDRSPESPAVRPDDSAWLASLRWKDSADPELIAAAERGDVAAFRKELPRWLGERPRKAKKSLPPPARQAAWLFAEEASAALDVMTRETLLSGLSRRGHRKQGDGPLADQITALLEPVGSPADISPRHLLGWLTLLAEAVGKIPEEVLFRLWRTVLEGCLDHLAETGEAGAEETLPWELDELGYRAGVLFPMLRESSRWRRTGRAGLRELLSMQVDDDGMPRASLVAHLPELLGSLLRVTDDARRFRSRLWSSNDQDRLLLLARRAAALCLPDGEVAGSSISHDVAGEILTAFCRQSGWRKKSEPLGYLLSLTSNKPRAGKASGRYEVHASPAWQSDEGRLAILRTGWETSAAAAVVMHDTARPRIELSIGGLRFLSGVWDLEAEQAGRPVELAAEWSCDCWHSDRDGDYLELKNRAGDVTVSRQIFLSRRDQFLLLIDALRSPSPVESSAAELFVRTSLPLVRGIAIEEDGSTREMQLSLSGQILRTIPISLPMDRVHSGSGRLDSGEGKLHFSTEGAGGVCQALVLDWSPERTRKPIDWSPVSVVEEGRPLTRSDALAARWRIGRKQWYYLQNLTRCEVARSALGHHTTSETVIGRFRKNGQIAPLVHISPEGIESPGEDAAPSSESP